MLRDRVVTTKSGASIEFFKNVPTSVVPQARAEVMEQGGVPEDASELEDEPKVPATPQGAERAAKIMAAMQNMVLKNDHNDFTAAGLPSVPAVSKAVDFVISPSERDEMWKKVQTGDD